MSEQSQAGPDTPPKNVPTPDAQAVINRILADAAETQPVWEARLDVLEGYVMQAMRRGWLPQHAQALVVHQFCSGG